MINYSEHCGEVELAKEIDNLEVALLNFNQSMILGAAYHLAVHNVWETMRVKLNAAKFDYERRFGRRNWRLDKNGTPTNKRTLEDFAPRELTASGEYWETKAYKMRNCRVVKEHNGNYDSWLGRRGKNVVTWWELDNGYAVAWNENPARGWSFPVHKIWE